MMEKLGQAKTHLELKKMIAEVDTNNSGVHMYVFIGVAKSLIHDIVMLMTV